VKSRRTWKNGGLELNQTTVALIAPGLAGLPPQAATSIEIYLYDVWRHLPEGVDARLYGRRTVLVKTRHQSAQHQLAGAVGPGYLAAVLRDIQRSGGSDIVQVDNRPAAIARVQSVLVQPTVLNLHSLTFLQPRALANDQARQALATAHRIVVNSHYLATALEGRFKEACGRTDVIHPGVDSTHFHPCSSAQERRARDVLRRQFGGDDQSSSGPRLIVLFVGRIIPRKGLHLVLEAMRSLRPQSAFALWVVGHPPKPTTSYGKRLLNLASGLPVTWFGYLGREQLPAVYRAADVLVCMSQQPEAFGLVNLEACASGLPVVGSRAWGIVESVQNLYTGLLVKEYTDPEAIAGALRELGEDASMRLELAAHAVESARRNFSWSHSAGQFAKLYRRLAGHSARR